MGRARTEASLTERQRAWLRHLQVCARSGETVRGYAKRRRLSEHALYQAAKELRRKGVWPRVPKGNAGKRVASPRSARFVEVKSTPTAAEPASAWRARLPNGVVLEGTTGLVDAVQALSRL